MPDPRLLEPRPMVGAADVDSLALSAAPTRRPRPGRALIRPRRWIRPTSGKPLPLPRHSHPPASRRAPPTRPLCAPSPRSTRLPSPPSRSG